MVKWEVILEDLDYVVKKRKKSRSSNSARSSPFTTGSSISQYKLRKYRWSISKNNLAKNRKLSKLNKSWQEISHI